MKKLLPILLSLCVTTSVKSQCNDLFLSEYMEGSSFNKVIEIYNPTGFNVPLSGLYSIRMFVNGSGSPTNIALTGTINAYSTYVICHTSADTSISNHANQMSGGLNFNGDDAIQLYSIFAAAPVDVIGVPGVDPGSNWLVNGVASTENHTLMRKSIAQMGNTTWTGSGETEWTVLPIDSFTMGHVMDPCGLTEPIATATLNDTCDGLSSYFQGHATDGSQPYLYFWDFGDGSPVDNNEFGFHTFPAAGTYTVTLIVVDQNLMDDTVTTSVTIHPMPVAAFSTSGSAANGCSPDTISFTNTSSNGVSYHWDFDNSTTSTLQNPPDKIYTTGSYDIELITMGLGGCSDTVTQNIIVNATLNITLLTNDTTICNNSFGINLHAAGPDGVWTGANVNDFGNGFGFFSSASIPAGTYYAVYTINNSCGFDTDSVKIMVEGPPTAGFTYVVNGAQVTFTNTTTNGFSYDWDFAGQGNSTLANPIFTFSSGGTFNVCLDAFSSAGTCVSTHCQNITITGVEEINPASFSVYPNPSNSGILTVNWKQAQRGILYITDITGKTMFTETVQPGMTKIIQTGDLQNGTYIIHWKTENGYSNTRFLIVR